MNGESVESGAFTRVEFENNETYLPVTMEQFQALTNEILTEVNKFMLPHAADGDYAAQIVMSAIHALDHKIGIVKKSELFEGCMNRISCHVTYHAVNAIQERLKNQTAPQDLTAIGDVLDLDVDGTGEQEAPATLQ